MSPDEFPLWAGVVLSLVLWVVWRRAVVSDRRIQCLKRPPCAHLSVLDILDGLTECPCTTQPKETP